jgi:prepilin-type N-terminal cleavage/methylation domain-containing protein
MDKGFSLIELAIALFILVLSVVFLVTLGINYLLILNSVKSRYLALNLAQEGIELAIALRNKQIETGSQPWVGVDASGIYCLSFNTTTKKIATSTPTSPRGCPTTIPGYTRLIRYSDFLNQTTDLKTATATKVTSEVYFGRDKIQLDLVLTKWHPSQ